MPQENRLPDRAAPHFPWDEFGCHDRLRTVYPLDWRPTRGVDLGIELEAIRELIGPFTPSSVFRTWDYHAGIYANLKPPQIPPKNSQHLFGRAADVPCRFDIEWKDFETAIITAAKRPGSKIRYIKFYPKERFAHVDIRPTTTLKIEGSVYYE